VCFSKLISKGIIALLNYRQTTRPRSLPTGEVRPNCAEIFTLFVIG
jgi:hypothetical protein